MINNLQVLRAFAAISIVFLHIMYYSMMFKFNSPFLKFFYGWGLYGVDLFFVLSGFIIYHIQINNNYSWFEFLKRRIVRVFPIYFILTILVSITHLIYSNFYLSLELTKKFFFSSIFFLSKILAYEYPIIRHGWTLEFEMYFYLAFSFLVFFRKKPSLIWLFLIILLLIISINNIIFLEFYIGVLISYFFQKKIIINLNYAKFIFFIGIFFLLIGSIFREKILSEISVGSYRIFFYAMPSALILIGALYLKQIKNKFLIFLGNSSYSIYLMHIFVIAALYKAKVLLSLNINENLFAFTVFFMSIMSSLVIYLILEKPSYMYLKNKLFKG